MKTIEITLSLPRQPRADKSFFRLSPIAAFVTGVTLSLANPVHAADTRTAAEIQSEVTRLKQQLEQEEQALAEKTNTSSQASKTPEKAKPEEATQLNKVVVRARNRIERLQDVPLSVSVVTGKELERLQAQDFGAITKRAANISWNQGNQRTSSISIRGIGKVGQTEAQDPSVGIIVDGVNYAYNPLSSSFDFTDVEAVEVTRGPQGTLQGKNSSLGVVNIITKRPSFTPSADWALSYGENDTVRARFAGGGPVIEDLLAWRTALSVSKGQGDLKNQFNPDNTYQNTDRVSGRLQFLLTPSEDFSARLALDAQPRAGENTNDRMFFTQTPATYSNGSEVKMFNDASGKLQRRWFTQQTSYTYAGDYLAQRINNDSQEPVTTGSNGASLELNKSLGDYNLVSISAYKDYHFNAHNNDEGTPFDIRSSSGQTIDYRQFSQEFRVSSQIENLVDWQAGTFLMKTSTNIRRNVIYGADAGAWFATGGPTGQYATLDTDNNGRYLMQNSLNGVWKNENRQYIENESAAIFGQANWHITDPLTVTTGLRLSYEHRENPGSSLIFDNGYGAELNPASVNNVQLGGFATDASGALTAGANSAAQLSLANSAASKYFGVANYGSLSAAQLKQIAAAKAIRASTLGVLWNYAEPERFEGLLPAFVISPSYKINENLTSYVSWQYGEKAGVAQQVNGNSYLADPEKSSSYELGLKSALFENKLILNADIFLTDIKNYQQAVQVLDQYTTNLKHDGSQYFTSTTGNAKKVQVDGLEIDGVYAGIPNTTLRFSGAYNHAIYKDFKNSPQPVETTYTGAPANADLTGETLAGAPKYTFNIGGDYHIPVSLGIFGQKEFHTDFNWAFTSSYNSDVTLSSYGGIPSYSLVDYSIGLSTLDHKFDVNIIVKNLFDNDTYNQVGTTTAAWNSYSPAIPRWVGIEFSGKL
ncbi:MAG: TonB-dependent receptor [Verrucomicrobiaceae bacterium]|nr:TonB-dependent receptor [Verrucomicrobiaceae bacterium]